MNEITALNNIPEKLDRAIKTVIDTHLVSNVYKRTIEGEKYYRTDNVEINARKHYVYAQDDKGDPQLIEDPYKANNKMASSFLKIQVDQKVAYSLGRPLTYEDENDEPADDFVETLGRNFAKTLRKIGKAAAKSSVGWGMPNITPDGAFELVHIPSSQVIAVYKDIDSEELEYGIRMYEVTAIKQDGTFGKTTQVEVWDDELVTIYRKNIDTSVYELLTLDNIPNPRYHFSRVKKYGETSVEEQGQSWGKVPFVPLYNNDELEYDLKPIKSFVDVYDIVQSDFANNLEDFQDVFWVLKGYGGTNVSKLLEDVKLYKSLRVGTDGDARAETIDIPHKARQVMLENLETAIYKFGMAVDPSKTKGGSLTNVHIKAMFANLDLKASEFEQQVRDFIWRLLYFVNTYRQQARQQPTTLKKIRFDRSMIINEAELLEANAGQLGTVSDETRLGNHPWVDDVEAEKERLEAEKGAITITDEG